MYNDVKEMQTRTKKDIELTHLSYFSEGSPTMYRVDLLT